MKDRTPLVLICVYLRSSVVYLQARTWQYPSKRQSERGLRLLAFCQRRLAVYTFPPVRPLFVSHVSCDDQPLKSLAEDYGAVAGILHD